MPLLTLVHDSEPFSSAQRYYRRRRWAGRRRQKQKQNFTILFYCTPFTALLPPHAHYYSLCLHHAFFPPFAFGTGSCLLPVSVLHCFSPSASIPSNAKHTTNAFPFFPVRTRGTVLCNPILHFPLNRYIVLLLPMPKRRELFLFPFVVLVAVTTTSCPSCLPVKTTTCLVAAYLCPFTSPWRVQFYRHFGMDRDAPRAGVCITLFCNAHASPVGC